MKVLTIAGNKPLELNISNEKDKRIFFVKMALKKRLISLIEEGLEWVIMSAQMGIELWAAEVVLELKEEYPIQLGIFPPFLEYESRWPEMYQESFLHVTSEADFFQPLYNQSYKGAFQFINKDYWLIEKSDGCLLLADEDYPGSVGYFLEKVKKEQEQAEYYMTIITPNDLEDVVREYQDNEQIYGDRN